VLRFKIVGIGRGPVPIQCRTYLLISHIALSPTSIDDTPLPAQSIG
jgi:hypothetical protein